MVCLVYSVTDYESFDALKFWAGNMEDKVDASSIKFVVGAKIDDTEADEMVPKNVA